MFFKHDFFYTHHCKICLYISVYLNTYILLNEKPFLKNSYKPHYETWDLQCCKQAIFHVTMVVQQRPKGSNYNYTNVIITLWGCNKYKFVRYSMFSMPQICMTLHKANYFFYFFPSNYQLLSLNNFFWSKFTTVYRTVTE